MSYNRSRSLIAIALALACSSGAASVAAACEQGAGLAGARRAARGAASYVPPAPEGLPIPRIARGTAGGAEAVMMDVSADTALAPAADPARRAARGG